MPVALLAAVLTIGLVACGDDTTTTPTTTPTTTMPVGPPTVPPITLIAGNEAIPARQLFLRDVKVDQAGRLEIAIEYTFADSQILFWLTDRKCSRQMFDNDSCNYLTKSLGGPTPRSATVPSVAPGTYTFFVANDGPHDEQLKYRLTLQP